MEAIIGTNKDLETVKSKLDELQDRLPCSQVEQIYMSVDEATRRYCVGKNTMYEIINYDGAPMTLKVGSRRLLPIKDYDKFMLQFGSN